jgi:hypothetical protein
VEPVAEGVHTFRELFFYVVEAEPTAVVQALVERLCTVGKFIEQYRNVDLHDPGGRIVAGRGDRRVPVRGVKVGAVQQAFHL